ncbi:MAG: SLC13 family permease [Thermoanaerobaculia bacterium]|nr:SLC13 family permease [Thermoanaerobaculia bacterium]
MTFEIGFLFALLVAMVFLFLTEKLPVDLTAFLGLVILIFGGYLTPAEAFTGFSSPAVITMLSVFIVGAALLETGVADLVGGRIHRIVGSSETRLIVVLMLVAGVLSAFMNNIAATAVLMPAVAAIAARAGLAPSRLFMPLAFGAILGGTTTLVGTPPNILAAQMLQERELEPFTLFDFTPIGLMLLAVGTVFMLTLGRKLLPREQHRGAEPTEGRDLAQVYQLQERSFSIRIPDSSRLDGLTIAETRLGSTLGVKVVGILRRGKKRLAPQADTVLKSGDVLFVDGNPDDLRELLRMDLQVRETGPAEIPRPIGEVDGVRARLTASSALAGGTLRGLEFRERYGLVVIGIRRDDRLFREHLGEIALSPGDELYALGEKPHIEALAELEEIEILASGLRALQDLEDQLYLLQIPPDSPLVGSSVATSRLGELAGITVAGVIREDETRLAVAADEILRAGDQLLIATKPERLTTLEEFGEVEVDTEGGDAPLETDEVGMVEVAIAPRSSVVGRTLAELDFTDRYGLVALALWRAGKPVHTDLAGIPLEFGDALLLHGPRDKIERLASDPDFVVLSGAARATRRTGKAKWAFLCLGVMIALVVSGYQPIHVAAFTAASLVVLSGALTMKEAYRAIEWKAIFLVAAVLPVGMAMERTGAALLLADTVASVAGPAGDYATLAALVLLASLLSQGLDGAPAVVLLAPVVLQTAEGLGISPYPLMMGVSLAASAAFMTPFSHKANLLVMGAGGYRSLDYLKVGTPLTVVLLALMVWMIPLFFPF